MIRALRVVCVGLSLLVVLFATVRWSGWWRVEEVWVSATRYVVAEQLTGILLGANVLRLQTVRIADWVRADPRVLETRIRVRPFGKRVEVEIKEREPAVQVELQGGAAVWVDADGFILESATRAAVVGAARRNGRVSPEVVNAAHRISLLDPALRGRLSVFDVSDPAHVVARGDGSPTVLLGEIGQLGNRLAILEELWERWSLAEYATVDLRVGDEVVLKRTR